MAHRVRPTGDIDGLPARPYYADAFAVTTPRAGERTARAWLDAVLDEAGPGLLTYVRVAQRAMGLQLVDPEPPNVALGWAVLDERPDRVVLGVEGLLYTPRVALAVRDRALLVVTTVDPHGTTGRAVWLVGALLHRGAVRSLAAIAERVAR